MFLTHQRGHLKFSIRAWLWGAVVAALFIAVHPGESQADLWTWLTNLVEESDEPQDASLSSMVLPPDAIVTAPGETRTIGIGRDLVNLYPSTAIMIEVSGQKTTVNLMTGTIRATVAKKKVNQAFEVQTPLLVGTVKGTVFEVSMTRGASSISVYEGRVALRAAKRVGGMDITPGNTGTVSDRDDHISVGKTPKGGSAAAAKAAAWAAGYADVLAPTDGPQGRGDTDNTGRTSSKPSESASHPQQSNGTKTAADTDNGDKDDDSSKDDRADGDDHDGDDRDSDDDD